MKVTLEFNLPEQQEEYSVYMDAVKNQVRLNDIWDVVFRPYMKHGYQDIKLNELLKTEDGQYIFNKLLDLYLSTGDYFSTGDD